MITEPSIISIDGKPVVNSHSYWSVAKPTSPAEESAVIHSFRSLIFVHKGVQFRQVHVSSSDITAGVLHTQTQRILAVSVYVPRDPSTSHEENAAQLSSRLELITQTSEEVKRKYGVGTQLLLAGDFNRHDQFWGGDGVITSQYHGEGTPILEWMGQLGLQSLLPRGTKTFQVGSHETTIDLMLASDSLAAQMLRCDIHEVEHGSDHRAIASIFNDRGVLRQHNDGCLGWLVD
jgi:hypothetical protein